MTFNAIQQLLENGISEDEILSSLIKKAPKLAKKASKMFFGGYTAKDVLNLFSRDKEAQKEIRKGFQPSTPSQIAAMHLRNSYNEGSSSQEEQARGDLIDFSKKAAPLALAAVAPYAAKAAAPMAEAALSRVLPNSLKQVAPQILQSAQGGAVAPQAAAAIPQAATATAPQGMQKVGDILSKYQGFANKIEDLRNSGNDANAIAAYLRKFGAGTTDKIEKESGLILEDIVQNYLNSNPTQQNAQAAPNQPQVSAPVEQPSAKLDEGKSQGERGKVLPIQTTEKPIEKPTEQPKLEKKMYVKTPKGVGEIKEIRNGQALVNVDNKVQKFSESELEGSPFSEDDIADDYDRLMERIPEAHKSSWIQWAGYDENTNTLGFIPRNGKYEELTNITPEEAQKIKEGGGVARTSGETKEGLWIMGESTKGGVVSQIIHDRKKANKEEEGKQGKFSFTEELEKQSLKNCNFLEVYLRKESDKKN
jgi:hypothetical protein